MITSVCAIIEEDGKTFGKLELVRPLPWILFLPGLVVLRTIRVGINIGAFIVGYPQIQPTDMVCLSFKFIDQFSRHRDQRSDFRNNEIAYYFDFLRNKI